MITTSQWVNNKLIKKEDGYYLEGEDQCVLFHHEYKGIKKGVELLCKKYKFESVLELGFGLGWTATEFQKQGIKRHIILEPNKEIYKNALKLNKNHNAEILNIFSWEYEPKEKFDLIYDDILEYGNTKDRHRRFINKFKNQWCAHCVQRREKNQTTKDSHIDFEIDEVKYRQIIRKL